MEAPQSLQESTSLHCKHLPDCTSVGEWSHSTGLAELGQSRADPLLPVLLDDSVTLMRRQKARSVAELVSVT